MIVISIKRLTKGVFRTAFDHALPGAAAASAVGNGPFEEVVAVGGAGVVRAVGVVCAAADQPGARHTPHPMQKLSALLSECLRLAAFQGRAAAALQ